MNIKIKTRGIIINENKILIVKHLKSQNIALPGGRLEEGEGILDCLKREMTEELGVVPEVGNILYVNRFTNGEDQYFEFLFHIKNPKDYLDLEKKERTHAFELESLSWISPEDKINFLPERLSDDFKNNKIDFNKTVFI